MLKKLDIAKKFIEKNNAFACPICKKSLQLSNNSLKCEQKHTFNLSKKGTINLINTSHLKESLIYNKELFINRRNFIKHNYYNGVYEYIAETINKAELKEISILDLGCGEAMHSINILNRLDKKYVYYGFDYSKDAISMASDYNSESKIFFNADVNNIPIVDKSINVIIDFLSPFNESEIKRVLCNNGLYIKISPGKEYLKELRKALNINEYEKEEEVLNNLEEKFNIVDRKEIKNTFSVNDDEVKELIGMTPMKIENKNITFNAITIDLNIYIIKR